MDIAWYYSTPPKTKYQLVIIFSFNSDKYKTILINLSLIENENSGTFINILNHLKMKFNFIQEKISIDFSKSGYKSLKKRYLNINIIPCFFHFFIIW